MNEEVKNSCVSASDFVRVDRGMDSDVIARPSISYWKDVWRRLKTDKVAIICMVYLLIVIAMAVLAPLLSQYSYDSTNLSHLNEDRRQRTGSEQTRQEEICGRASGWAPGYPCSLDSAAPWCQ